MTDTEPEFRHTCFILRKYCNVFHLLSLLFDPLVIFNEPSQSFALAMKTLTFDSFCAPFIKLVHDLRLFSDRVSSVSAKETCYVFHLDTEHSVL